MKCRRSRRTGFAFERLRRCAATSVTGVVLVGAVCVSSASAGLVKDVGSTVGSTVKSVQDTAKSIQDTAAAPPPPSTSPPVKPPKSSPAAGTPTPPPRDPVKLPGKEPSPSPSRSSADSADPPSADGVAGAAPGVVGSVTGVGNKAANGTATYERSGGAPAAASQHRADRGASEASVPRSRTGSSPPVAVRAAEVAALQRWLARVWPAIALGGGEISGVGMVETIAGDLFRPALAAITGVLLASSPILPTSGDPLPLSGHQGVAGASRSAPAPPPVPATGDGGGIVYLIAIAGLLALLAFTVWREFRIALHPGLR